MSKNKIVCSLLRRSILELCKASIPEAEGVEVDGIVCISLGKDTDEQIVVKIHEVLFQTWPHNAIAQEMNDYNNPAEKINQKSSVLTESSLLHRALVNQPSPRPKRPNKRKSSCPLPVLNRKQPCFDVESEFGDPLEPVESNSVRDILPRSEIKTEPHESIINETVKNVVARSNNNGNNISLQRNVDEVMSNDLPTPISIEPSEMYVCDVCKLCFTDQSAYSQHIQVSQHGKVSTCQYCNRKFTNFNSFVFHMRSHGAPETTGDFWKGKPLRCGVCSVVLRSKRGILDHMRGEHQYVKCYTCTTCEEIYPDFNTFRSHRKQLHSNVNQCRCEMCDLFFTFTEYKDHEKECVIKIYFDCIINKSPVSSFEQKSFKSVSVHDAGIIKVRNTNENVTIVDETQPKVSTVTPVSSPNDSMSPALKNTTTIQTDHSPIISPMEGPFRCQSCFSVFQEFEQYETHNHEMHSRFVCSFCAQSFATRRNLQRHARRHTGVRPYQCMDCECNFTRDDDLKKHMIRLHHMTGYKFTKTKVSKNLPMQIHNSLEVVDSSSFGIKIKDFNSIESDSAATSMLNFTGNDTDSEKSNSAYTLGTLYEENVLINDESSKAASESDILLGSGQVKHIKEEILDETSREDGNESDLKSNSNSDETENESTVI